MAYTIPLDQPLSETQAKLIAQVGSMKNLANLSFLKKFINVKKGDEISLYDYLLKILRSMGIDPTLLLTAFLNDFFRTEKLVELLLTTMSRLATAMKVCLDPSSNFNMPPGQLTNDQIKELADINYNWLSVNMKGPLTQVIEPLRTKILQDLMILIFGKPKKSTELVSSENRLNDLLDEAVCGGAAIFSVSSPANTNNGELEYNRLQKLEQVKNGDLSFKVTCEGVKISLPDDPMYLFRVGLPGIQSSIPTTPQEAMTNVFNLVGNQIKKGTSGNNSQSNAKTGEKSFVQKLLETLISSITCLLNPFLVGFINEIPGEANGVTGQALTMLEEGLLNMIFPNSVTTDQATGKRVGDYVPATSCEIISGYSKGSLTPAQQKKTALMTILCNLILNMAIGFIMAYVLEKIKKMILMYISKRAQERAKRKIQKMKDKYQAGYLGQIQKKAQKSAKQVRLMQKVVKALQYTKNVNVPQITL